MSRFPNTQTVLVSKMEKTETHNDNARSAFPPVTIPLGTRVLTESSNAAPSAELCLSDSSAVSHSASSDSYCSSYNSFGDNPEVRAQKLSFERNTILECSSVEFVYTHPTTEEKTNSSRSTVLEYPPLSDSDEDVSSSLARAWMSLKLFKTNSGQIDSRSSSRKIAPQADTREEKCIGRKCHMSSHSLDTEANGAKAGPTRTLSSKMFSFSQSEKRRASTPNLRRNEGIMRRALSSFRSWGSLRSPAKVSPISKKDKK